MKKNADRMAKFGIGNVLFFQKGVAILIPLKNEDLKIQVSATGTVPYLPVPLLASER
jgi:hypothetical protein